MDKYQSERHVKIFKTAFDSAIAYSPIDPWDCFIFAIKHEWEDSAKLAITRFRDWSFTPSDWSKRTFLPEHLPLCAVRALGLEIYGCYVRACDECRDGDYVYWAEVSKQFSLKEPEWVHPPFGESLGRVAVC
jgi:hypothetical protein